MSLNTATATATVTVIGIKTKLLYDTLNTIANDSYPLDSFNLQYSLNNDMEIGDDSFSFKEFIDQMSFEEQNLILKFIAGDKNVILEKIDDDDDDFYAELHYIQENSIETTDDLKSDVQSSSVETRTTLIDGNSKSEMVLTADKIYLNAETTSDEDIPEAPQQETTVVVYTNNAQTLIFHGVSNFQVTSTGYGFDYLGKATGITRHAVFNNASTAGYAIAKEVL